MATILARKWMVLGLLMALSLRVPALATAQTTFDRIVVFGDSLSDPGNAFALLGVSNTPPYPAPDVDELIIPDRPYAKGGHHFSNGATWIEQMARSFGLAGNVRPAYRELGTSATNYAIGGARTRQDGSNTDLSHQLATFFSIFGADAPDGALYVIEFGSNDIRDTLYFQDPTIVAQAISSIQAGIASLYDAGARKFLVCNAPDLSLTPAIISLGPQAAAAAHEISTMYNFYLGQLLSSMAQLPEIQIVRVKFDEKLWEMVTEPSSFGLSVVDTACLKPGTPPYTCQDPDEYLFWDGIHPTKAVHAVVAQEALAELAK